MAFFHLNLPLLVLAWQQEVSLIKSNALLLALPQHMSAIPQAGYSVWYDTYVTIQALCAEHGIHFFGDIVDILAAIKEEFTAQHPDVIAFSS